MTTSSSLASSVSPPAPALAVDPGAAATHGWRRAIYDLDREHGYTPLRLEGQLPAGLSGTLYRNGPATFSSQRRSYRHLFDGDGAVSAVRLGHGQAQGAIRLTQSLGLQRERAAGRPLFGGYGTPAPIGWLKRIAWALTEPERKNTANTSVMLWQGRLLALMEGGRPTELSPADLSTLGESDLGGAVLKTFSAHPHRVESRRASYNFGVRYGRHTELDLFELPDAGPARRLASVPLTGPTMLHDFIATSRHLIFFAPPLRLELFRMVMSLGSYSDNLRWQPELGTEVMVISIDQPTTVRRFTVPAFYQWHFANAFEQGDELTVDFVRCPDFSTNQTLGEVVRQVPSRRWDGLLSRARLNLRSGDFVCEPLCAAPCEFPSVADAEVDRPARYIYLNSYTSKAAEFGLFDQLSRYDLSDRRLEHYPLAPGQYPSEPLFVPRPDASAADDGWLLSQVYDAPTDRSHLVVLDAARPGSAPLCRAHFDHPLPLTFHGRFYPSTAG